ncbi:hypothetical protein GOC69_12130 [Sinorhizobium medicae]|nr:hypothetical protein [Sinorhizobium medicae]MDX0475195.1 hypothetical protein [Sinorhizobium medicae]
MTEEKKGGSVTIKLTEEQKQLIKRQTGKDVDSITLDDKLELKRVGGVNPYD